MFISGMYEEYLCFIARGVHGKQRYKILREMELKPP
jgi:hypothetical protein